MKTLHVNMSQATDEKQSKGEQQVSKTLTARVGERRVFTVYVIYHS